MCGLIFCTALVWNISDSKNNPASCYQTVYIYTHIGLHVKWPILLSDFIRKCIFSTDFRNILKYQISFFIFWRFAGRASQYIALHSLWYHTRGCVIQFWPPDDQHMCSKHVEAWNKLTVKQKFCASSWLITEINSFFMFVPCINGD